MNCTCGSKNFLHLSSCDSVPKPKIPLQFLHIEGIQNPGSIIFYVTSKEDDSIKQLEIFRQSISEAEWMYTVQAGNVGTVTLQNTTEITFLPESEAFLLLELPNSHSIFFEITEANKPLAEQLMSKTSKVILVNPETKELT